jgi:hypothetical protein
MRVLGERAHGKKWAYVERVMVSSAYAALNAYCFFNEFRGTDRIMTQEEPGGALLAQAKAEMGFYMAYSAIELSNMWRTQSAHTRMMVVHHVLALIAIGCAHANDLHQCICVMLFAFTSSTPPLAISIAQRRLLGEGRGACAFVVFAVMFVVFRICFVPCIMKFTLVDGLALAMHARQITTYAVLNGLLTVIYAMQWVWMRKILATLTELRCAKKIG